MRLANIRLLAGALLLTACSAAEARLSVGDKAPPLNIEEWTKGDPVDFPRDIGKRVYVIEFWATWCPPCKASVPRLTDFQKKYEDELTIIGVTAPDDRGNTPRAVRRFVNKQGSAMEYTVAIDKNMKTTNAYMSSAGAVGIPHAFIVGREGYILWQGSPLDPSLGDVLAQVVEGTYNLERARVQGEVERRFQALDRPAQFGQWSVVWDGLIGILKLDPANAEALDLLVQVYVSDKRDKATFRSWASAHIASNRNNKQAMQRLAAVMCANGNLRVRTPDLALEAAKAAYEATTNHSAWSTAVYAQALYQIGKLDEAVTLQQDALAVADERDRRMHQEILDYYKLCKRLRDSA